jgi:serine/threonine protein kinase/formylglycine-generating enzyme required for sulfatase activity
MLCRRCGIDIPEGSRSCTACGAAQEHGGASERIESPSEVVFDFVDQFQADRASGAPPSLAHYLARFPGHEEDVAREFLRLVDDVAPVPEAAAKPVPSAVPLGESGLLARLERKREIDPRYTPGEEVGRGGMGAILEVRDEELRRNLAMKVMLSKGARNLARFVEEAQITGALDHPGVVPVHDLGLDAQGRLYFTMRLVRGRDLRHIIDLVHRGEAEWTFSRALEVVVKVCDAMAYAHSKGVIHRDLKPANVMVGNFGEVYVMDWGLARVLGREDLHDLRLRSTSGPETTVLFTQRSAQRDATPHSPLLTLDGDVVGTPVYMAPEQAAGRASEIGPRSDVYSVGAMLYHLMAGCMPYAGQGAVSNHHEVLERVLEGPPQPVHLFARRVPAELAAICERAMAREPDARYADMRAMARDLRAYLDLRVVSAYRTGALAELRKWVARNRALSSSIAAAVLLVIVGAVIVFRVQASARESLRLLADVRGPAMLAASFDGLWPAVPERIEPMSRWLAEAEVLVERLPDYTRELDALRERALPEDPDSPLQRLARRERAQQLFELRAHRDYYVGEVARVTREGGVTVEGENLETVRARAESFATRVHECEEAPFPRLTWTFADSKDQSRHDALASLVEELQPFVGAGTNEGWIARVRQGLEYARRSRAPSLTQADEEWSRAIASIADPAECPAYGGLQIAPQLGLVPIGRDPVSGLWEFAHVQSGDPPVRDANGKLVVDAASAIVLVLIPPGTVVRGAQSTSESGPHYDHWAEAIESPVKSWPIWPFFLSKYEMTQAQWKRLAGWGPSESARLNSPLQPVGNVSWTECSTLMAQLGLALPSETQWEYAARAGTVTPWSSGATPASLKGFANLASSTDVAGKSVGGEALWLDDGFEDPAPIGAFLPNAFGLHDVHGNVMEWCRDLGAFSYETEVTLGTLERRIHPEGLRAIRGGGWGTTADRARSASRAVGGAERRNVDIGLRPSRELDH